MTPRIYFILTFTFITGMFAGAYLYITSFAPDYQQSDVEELSDVDFRIQGQMVGGCQRAGVCPSFILNQNRRYEYIPAYNLQEGEPEAIEGKYDTDGFAAVLETLRNANMEVLTKENSVNCNSYVDGTDYEYYVMYEGQAYELSTCGMNFKNSALELRFRPLWEELATSTKALPLFDDGIDGFFKDQLDKRFEYDDAE